MVTSSGNVQPGTGAGSGKAAPRGTESTQKLKDYSTRERYPYLSGPSDLDMLFKQTDAPKVVSQLHRYDDLDSNASAHHHTLGTGPAQSLPGSWGPHIFEVGAIQWFAASNPPGGYLLCDGGTYDCTDYPHLANHLGITDFVSSPTFNVPLLTSLGAPFDIIYPYVRYSPTPVGS